MEDKRIVSETPIDEYWKRSVKWIGIPILLLAMAASFLPFLYMCFVHKAIPAFSNMLASWGGIASIYLAFYIIEPVSYYPSLGMSGSYMAWLAGSASSMRVPAAVVAKDLADVKDGTLESEIVVTAAVSGSVLTSMLMVALAALAGSSILSILPETVKNAMSTYIAPAIFGAVFAMFSESKPKLAFPAFIGAFGLNFLVKYGVIAIPSWGTLILSVAGVMIFARVMYKMGRLD